MSPEQAGGRRARPASDWYAVGVILYEALTGALPFWGSPIQIIFRKQQEEAPPPRPLAPGAPDDLIDLCVALLRRDPEARPSGEEVLRRLGGAVRAPAVASLPAQERRFFGRARELRELEGALREVQADRAMLAVVQGRSGMGKSALVHRFTDELGCDVVVLSGRCYERESVPYKAFDSLVDGLTAHLRRLPPDEARGLLPRDVGALARLFPVLRRIDGVPRDDGARDQRDRLARAYGALRELLAGIARRAPLVLTIDDLQWGDADSARLLEALLSPPRPPPLLVVAAFRSEEAEKNPLLREIGRLAALHVRLSLLSASEAEQLALWLLPPGAEAAERARAISREAGGLPFLVDELARWSGGASDGREPSLDRLLAMRLERLPAEARRLLELCAVAGRPTPQQVLFEALGAPEAHAALRVLRTEGLIRTQGMLETDVVETYHNRIREGVIAALDPATLRGHHARLAATLEAANERAAAAEAEGVADAEILAEHHEAAGDRRRAGAFVLAAAEEAARALAFHRAAQLYARRIELDEADGRGEAAEVDALRVKLGDALEQCGRGPEAARAYLEAAGRAAPEAARDLCRRAAEQLLISGHIAEGREALDGVLHAVGMKIQASPNRALLSFLAGVAKLRLRGVGFKERAEADIDPTELARVDVCFTAASGLTFVDAIRAADFQAQHLLLALRAGEPSRVALGLANYAAFLSTEGGSTARVASLLASATAIATRLDHPRALGRARMAAGSAAFFQGRFREGLTILDEAERTLSERCTGVAWELDGTQLWARLALIFLGELRELDRRATVQLSDARWRGDRFAETWIRASAVAHERLAADDPESARAAIAAALAPWEGQSFLAIHFLALWHEGLTALYEGDGEGALARLEERWPAVERSLLLRMQIARVVLVWLRAAAAVAAAKGDPRSPHLSAAERDARRIADEGPPYATAMAAALRAGIAATRGRRAEAAAQLRVALEGFDLLEMTLFAACARRRLAELTEDGDEAATLRATARAYFAVQGIRRPDGWCAVHVAGA
jgi:hypothetical protein